MKPYHSPSPSAKALLDRARHGRYAIGAFNVANLETLTAVVRAAKKLRSPVIIEASHGEVLFFGAELLAQAARIHERQARVPLLVNLDHAKSYREVMAGLHAGFGMLHFDGSEMPKATNIRTLKRIVTVAHRNGLTVEGELDHITGSSRQHRGSARSMQMKGNYSDPVESAAFVRATGVDIFAAFFGNVHGVYSTNERLDFDVLKRLRAAVRCHLSLHGGSGIDPRDVRRAIGIGITKVNVNTDMRIVYARKLRKQINKKNAIVPYEYMEPVITAVQKVVEEKMHLFGSAGKART